MIFVRTTLETRVVYRRASDGRNMIYAQRKGFAPVALEVKTLAGAHAFAEMYRKGSLADAMRVAEEHDRVHANAVAAER